MFNEQTLYVPATQSVLPFALQLIDWTTVIIEFEVYLKTMVYKWMLNR